MIKALPAVETITYADKDICKAANDAYNELTAEQIGLLDDDLFYKLCDAMDVIYDIEAAMAVEALIEALPEKITSENMAQFEEVFDAHFDLTANQIEYISQENESKYKAAANARGYIIGPIERLPENITLADKAAVDSLKEQYDKASDASKAFVGDEYIAKMNAAIAAVVTAQIDALPDSDAVTVADKDAVNGVKDDYMALSKDQLKLVPFEAKTKLTLCLLALGVAEDKAAAAEVSEMIKALPDPARVTVDDKDAIEAAFIAYGNLSERQVRFLSSADEYKLKADISALRVALKAAADEAAAEEVEDMIRALPSSSDVTLDDKDAIEEAAAAFEALSTDQKLLVNLTDRVKLNAVRRALKPIADQAAAAAVEELIDALPETVTLKDKEAIEEAAAAYDALTADQKKLVALADRLYLTAAKAKLAALEDEAAGNAVEDMIRALPDPADVTVDDKDAIEEAAAAFDALTDAQKKYVTLVDEAKLNAVKAALKKAENDINAAETVAAMIEELPAAEDVTLDDASAILAAKAAYNALTEEQKALIDEDIVKALDDAYDAYAGLVDVQTVEALINKLPEDINYFDKPAVEEARAAYEALTDAQKAKVDDETVQKLTDAEEAIAEIEADRAAAAAVEELIEALPNANNVTLKDKDAIEAARAAFDALTDDQKNIVSLADKVKLALDENAIAEAEKLVEDEAAAEAVEDIIRNLPAAEDITLDDKEAVEEARAAYDALTHDQKLLVNLTDRIDLVRAEAAIKKLENDVNAAETVAAIIEDLPEAEDVTLDDARDILAARAAYEALTDDQKALIDEDTLKKLTDAEDALLDNAAADTVKAVIDALPAADEVTVDDKAGIEAARDAYDNLTDAQKAKIDEDTYKKLTDAEDALAEAEARYEADKAAAAAVEELIEALPNANDVTLEDKDAIEAARAAFDELTDDQKNMVSLADKIKLALDENAIAEAEKFAEDEAAADAVEDIIRNLPAAEDITLDDKEAVEEARAAYDALTHDQKLLVNLTDRIDLVRAEAAIKKLENDVNAAETVAAIIEDLPEAEDVTLDDARDILAARAAYEALTDDQKALIDEDTLKKLTDAEDALLDNAAAEIVKAMINSLPDADDVTMNDKPAIEAARAAYDNLTDAQKAKIDEDTYKKLTDAEEALNSLFLLGDVDNDGEVTALDATWIQRLNADMELGIEINEKAADVDGDGEITVLDATLIQRYVAEIPVLYPIGEYV